MVRWMMTEHPSRPSPLRRESTSDGIATAMMAPDQIPHLLRGIDYPFMIGNLDHDQDQAEKRKHNESGGHRECNCLERLWITLIGQYEPDQELDADGDDDERIHGWLRDRCVLMLVLVSDT